MNLVAQRRSLLSESTSILRKALTEGEWGPFMPGERRLCELMQIGRDTLRLAIGQMEREGLVGAGEPGKRRRILSPGGKKTGESAQVGLVVYLSPYPLKSFSSIALLEIDVLRESLGKAGFRLEVVGSAAFAMRRPGKTLENLITEYGTAVWILHQSTAPMQRWFSRMSLPCLLHGQPQEGVDLPSVDIDYEAVARHAGGQLIRQGHRRVVLLRPADKLRGLEMAEAGLRSAFSSHLGNSLDPPVIAYEGPDKASLVSKLSALLGGKGARPTAIIATRPRQIPTVISWLAQHGFSVPRDLSVIALDWSPNLDYFVPDIACYRVDTDQVAKMLHRKVIDIAGAGGSARSPRPMMPDFIPGGSVGQLSRK